MTETMKTGYILNLYLNADEYLQRHLASEAVMTKLLELHFTGASLFSSRESFGAHRRLERSHLLSTEDERGIVIQVVDESQERLESFLSWLDHHFAGHLVTITETRFRLTGPTAPQP
jgi:PII-like signaling protein